VAGKTGKVPAKSHFPKQSTAAGRAAFQRPVSNLSNGTKSDLPFSSRVNSVNSKKMMKEKFP